MGQRVELVRCGRADADAYGFAEASAPRGKRTDCIVGADAYSRGPRWHICWSAFGDADLRSWPASSNPFTLTRRGGL
jgi:hypothetical protein